MDDDIVSRPVAGSEILKFGDGSLVYTQLVRHPGNGLERVLNESGVLFLREDKSVDQLRPAGRDSNSVHHYHTLFLGTDDYFPAFFLNPLMSIGRPYISIVGAKLRKYGQVEEVKKKLPKEFDSSLFNPHADEMALLDCYTDFLDRSLRLPRPEMGMACSKASERCMQRIYRGLLLQKRNDEHRAREEYLLAKVDSPDFFLPHYHLGKLEMESNRGDKSMNTALKHLTHAWALCDIFEERRKIFMMRIHALYALGAWNDAESYLQEIVDISEQDGQHDELYKEAVFLQGIVDLQVNRKAAAIGKLEKVLRIDPKNKQALDVLESIQGS